MQHLVSRTRIPCIVPSSTVVSVSLLVATKRIDTTLKKKKCNPPFNRLLDRFDNFPNNRNNIKIVIKSYSYVRNDFGTEE